MTGFDPGNRLVAALDVPTGDAAADLVSKLDGAASWLKVGLELFVAEGPHIVTSMVDRGQVMLDLKLHDIPATVGRATSRVAALGAGLLTVHAGGGGPMLRAAVAAAAEAASDTRRLRVLAITVLTSMDEADLRSVCIAGGPTQTAIERARLAIGAGCDGVVASPQEAPRIREMAPPGFLIVTPGVRPAGAGTDDQKRVATPRTAREAGADLIVCGRPIRDAADPAAAARAIAAELA